MSNLQLVNRKTKDWRTAVIPLIQDTLLGRSPPADILIKDIRVSRTHCFIILKKKFIILRCLSAKGIRVNGELLMKGEETRLEQDDIINFANAEELSWKPQTEKTQDIRKK